MRTIRGKLTYANVVSTLCMFLLLGGGAALAAGKLGKDTIGTKQIKSNAITTAKIKDSAVTEAKLASNAVNSANLATGAVTGAKVAGGTLTGANIQSGSLTGADINQGSLNAVRASNVTAIAITSDEHCSPSLPLPSGVTSERLNTGVCKITFPQTPASCVASATIHLRDLGAILLVGEERTAQVFDFESEPKSLIVDTYNGTSLGSLPFDLTLVC